MPKVILKQKFTRAPEVIFLSYSGGTMQNATDVPFEDLYILDKVAFKLPYYLYASDIDPRIITGALILGLALFCVNFGSKSTIGKPRNALNPNEDIGSLWDPTDNDRSNFITSTIDLEDLNGDVLGMKQAVLAPVVGGCTLLFLNYAMKNFVVERLSLILNYYVLVLSITSNFSSTEYFMITIVRRLTHWFGKNSLWAFPRYRITFAEDTDMFPLGPAEGSDRIESNEEKLRVKRFKQHLRSNNVSYIKPTDVKTKNQLFNLIFDFKFLYVLPISLLLSYQFYHTNPVLNSSYPFQNTNWIASNISGINLAIFGIKNIKISTFKVAYMLLSGLFFYDIYFVFKTKVMTTVATGLDIPIKLSIPLKPISDNYYETPMSLIGLGDIVVPGVLVACCLKLDLHNHYKNKKAFHHLESFKKPYFYSAILSYSAGVIVTIAALNIYKVGQPALFYIVPSMLFTVTFVSLVRGEFKELWNFSDSIEDFDEKKYESSSSEETEIDDTDEEYNYQEPDYSYDEWEALVELKRSGEEGTPDQIIYEFGNTDDEEDDTFIIPSDSESDEDLSEDNITTDEIAILRKDISREAKEWYSDED